MSNTKTCEAFHHDADDDAKHGGAAIEALNMLQLLNKVQLVRAVIKHLIVRNSVGHFRAKSSVGKIRLVESTNIQAPIRRMVIAEIIQPSWLGP